MRILHISDLHLGLMPKGCQWLLDKRVLGVFTQQVRRRHKQDTGSVERLPEVVARLEPEFVVCTGDLGSIGEAVECRRAVEALRPLKERFGERFLYVPGNHDAYVACNRWVLEETSQALNGFGLDEYPQVRSFPQIDFILVNGAVPMPPWKSGGMVRQEALDKLERVLSEPRREGVRRVMVCHFPIYDKHFGSLGWRRRISCENVFRRWAEEKLYDMLLCGHLHEPFVYRRGNWLQVCAGSLTLARLAACIDVSDSITCDFIDI